MTQKFSFSSLNSWIHLRKHVVKGSTGGIFTNVLSTKYVSTNSTNRLVIRSTYVVWMSSLICWQFRVIYCTINCQNDLNLVLMSNWDGSQIIAKTNYSWLSMRMILNSVNKQKSDQSAWKNYWKKWKLSLTWGILKSRKRLATWMDVTLEAAPTTPDMTLLCISGLFPSWHFTAPSSMLLIDPASKKRRK